MMKFIKTDNTAKIDEFRKGLYQRFTAPLDAMWEQLYIASSQHYLINEGDKNIGYCCIDNSRSLKQIFLIEDSNFLMSDVVHSLIDSALVSFASLSSIEPISFNACLLHSKSIRNNTFCFEYSNSQIENGAILNIELVSVKDIPAVKAFMKEQIGFDDTFGYTENLVNRKESYMLKESNIIIATSECRLSDSQKDVADLRVIVHKQHQGKGIATQILKQQVKRAQEANRRPICSTTFDNLASKKAIEKAGFYCSNIIFDINFTESEAQEP